MAIHCPLLERELIDHLFHEIVTTGSESESPEVEILGNNSRSRSWTAASGTEHDALLWAQNRSLIDGATQLAHGPGMR